jgi:hypothetical protein
MVRLMEPGLTRVHDLPNDVPQLGREVAPSPLSQRAIQERDLPAIERLAAGCSTAWLIVSEPRVWGVDMGSDRLRAHLERRGFSVTRARRFLDAEVLAYAPAAAPRPAQGP